MGLLDNMLRGSMGPSILGAGMGALGRGRGMSPLTLALLGTLAYRTLKGKGRLADMLGKDQPDQAPAAKQGGPLGDLVNGGALSEGLKNLLNRFTQNGQGDKLESWITKGPNKSISTTELEEALGPERIAWLMEQTDLSKAELLAGLSNTLPTVVDTLTPEGRIPTEQETQRLA